MKKAESSPNRKKTLGGKEKLLTSMFLEDLCCRHVKTRAWKRLTDFNKDRNFVSQISEIYNSEYCQLYLSLDLRKKDVSYIAKKC